MLKMDFEKESFDVVLDKGSYDALCVDEEAATQEKVSLFCDGVKRVLKHTVNSDRTGGYLCVSLLQDFVLDSMLKNFTSAGSPAYCINIIMIH